MPEKWDPGLGTRDLYVEPGSRDLPPGTRGLRPIGGTRDPGLLRGTRDLRPSICAPGPRTLLVGPYYIETSPMICSD